MSGGPRIARRVLVSGRVQGVAFRWATQRRARDLGLAGWVRNLRDGRVEVFLETDAEARLAEMLAWLAKGPPPARVDALDVREREPEGATSFEIERTM